MTVEAERTRTSARVVERLPRHISVVIGLMLVSAFVVILNETIMAVALPHLMADLHISASIAQWVTTGYLLTMAVVIPMTGRILERFTTRAVFITATSLFTVGTTLAAISPDFALLLVGRIVQASGAALVLPLLTTTVLTFVPASRRGRMMGLISIVISVAPAIGPTISGVILKSLSWRWMFLLVAPIAALVQILGIVLVKNITSTRLVRFDLLSVLLSAVGFAGLIYGLSAIGPISPGRGLISPLIPIASGTIALALFIFRQMALQARDQALLNLRPFGTSAFTAPVVLIVVSFVVLFGSLILLPIYIQNVLALSTLQTGLALLPGGLAMGLSAPIVGRLFDQFGARPLVIPGAVVLSGSAWALTTLDSRTPVTLVIGLHTLLSIALAFLMTPLMTSALGSLSSDLYPHGNAIINTLQQIAGAAGTSLYITLFTLGTSAGIGEGRSYVTAQAAGVHVAFLVGAMISVLGMLQSFLIKGTRDFEAAPPLSH